MIYFIIGFGMGLAVSVPILALFWMGAHKAAEIAYKSKMLSERVDIMNSKKRMEESIAKLRSIHPDMSSEQEAVARKELNGDVFQARYTR